MPTSHQSSADHGEAALDPSPHSWNKSPGHGAAYQLNCAKQGELWGCYAYLRRAALLGVFALPRMGSERSRTLAPRTCRFVVCRLRNAPPG